MKILNPDYIKNKLLPAIIQDFKSGKVLMLGYMDENAYKRTVKTQVVWFWSRKGKKLWQKGETSGNILIVKKILIDCDADTILVKVKRTGTDVCHKKTISCFTEITK